MYFETAPNFDNYSFEELVDAFIHIDDSRYEERALSILKRLAEKLNLEIIDIEMENIVDNPTQSYIALNRGMFFHAPSQFVDESYTHEGLEVKEKLARLKLILNKPINSVGY
ncbi:hypothetical protein QWY77_09285 [Thalassotalea ponticola]|uniref:hypothetical protein n=1 Tax=Thalassotalea ponticola TaxID=1523392 RepID=UPI0025B44ABE|nr:hypothetical protein [Thalassotalea ponticola]MDN3652949.1 hypothetical protein [Thalassotalea ponticola]